MPDIWNYYIIKVYIVIEFSCSYVDVHVWGMCSFDGVY